METDERLLAGRYRLHEQIGSGGMGAVWLATDTLLQRRVALKQVRLQAGDDPGLARERILREARISAQLQHPGIVTLHDVVLVGEDPWLVMEYVPSQSLSQAITARGPQPLGVVVAIGVAVADALAVAHASGVVHRDVKPGNVLLTAAGGVKLTDFGIAHFDGESALTATEVVTGTPGYLAPEVVAGFPSSPSSDVYSLGATLYAAVDGTPPYGPADSNVLRLLRRIGSENPPPPRNAGILTPVLMRMMSRDPAWRPSATVAAQMLRTAGLGNRPALPRTPAPRRRRLIWAAVALVVAAALTATALVLLPRLSTTGAPATAAAPPPLGIGPEPRLNDPCSLVDAAALQPFGTSRLFPEHGLFSDCEVDVTGSTSSTGYAVVTGFASPVNPGDSLPAGTTEKRGDLTVLRQAPADGACQRVITLPDGFRIVASSTPFGGATGGDACGMADAATTTALTRLAGAGIGRRPLPEATNSLAGVNACSLIDDGAMAAVGATPPRPFAHYFGDWTCDWRGSVTVSLFVGRWKPLSTEDGTPTNLPSGRAVFVNANAGTADRPTCLVQAAQRSFTAANGSADQEMLGIYYSRKGATAEQACQAAVSLMSAAASKLPPPS